MKYLVYALFLIFVLPAYADLDLWDKFINPPNDARTKVWWFHGETETTKEGIDADLEAFRSAGIGGVVFYDQVHGNAEGALDAMSPDWWRMLKYAALKAKELGLTFEVAASNGYVAGGPWITPDLAMQKLVAIDTAILVEKPQIYNLDLSHIDPNFRQVATLLFPDSLDYKEIAFGPESCNLTDNEEVTLTIDAGLPIEVGAISYETNPRGKGSTGSMNIPGMPGKRYFGALYAELPSIGTLEYSLDGYQWYMIASLPSIESNIGFKSRERTVSFPSVKGRWFRVRFHDWMDNDGKFNKLQIKNLRLSTRDLIDNWQMKSGLRTEVTYPHLEGGNRGAIDPAKLEDVTRLTNEDGKLHIFLQPGYWHVVRFGYIPTYSRTKHGRRNLLGLEANVMSAEAVKVHYDHYFKAISDTLESIGCKVSGMCMDSHEAGNQNWAPEFQHRFAKLNGYEIQPWLPVLTGYIVGDRFESEQFLRDFRLSLAETISSEFFGTFADLCRNDEVTFTSQAMINISNDNILSRSFADKPQGEFWAYQTNGNYDCLDAASTAHLYGRKIASGEAFTDSPYEATWEELIRIANLAYCRGINEFAVCAASYQPWLDKKYDDSFSAHPYIFHRHNPAWASVGNFWEYQARCATLLREGDPIVDLCIYLGEDFPVKTFAYKLPVIPEGYNFDVCSRDALINRFSASSKGELQVEGGMRYRVLVVQDRSYCSPEALQKIAQLENEGVPVIRCDRGEVVEERLREIGVIPDLNLWYNDSNNRIHVSNLTEDRINFFHRKTSTADIYFLYNHSQKPFEGSITFRTPYSKAEIWNPSISTRSPIHMNEDKTMQLNIDPYESFFIVIQ